MPGTQADDRRSLFKLQLYISKSIRKATLTAAAMSLTQALLSLVMVLVASSLHGCGSDCAFTQTGTGLTCTVKGLSSGCCSAYKGESGAALTDCANEADTKTLTGLLADKSACK